MVAIYHVNLGIRLDKNEVPRALTPAARKGLLLFGVLTAVITYRVLTTSVILLAKIIAVGWLLTAVIIIAHRIFATQKEYKYITKHYRELVEAAHERTPTHTIYGRYYVDSTGRRKEEYMLWRIREDPVNHYVLWDKTATMPAVKVGNHYVVFLPKGRDYYLKLSRNLNVETEMDKLRMIQDGKEVEIYYVTGKSRSGRLELRLEKNREILAKLEGIPFLKEIFYAGRNEEEVVLIFSEVKGWKQQYSDYKKMLREFLGEHTPLASSRSVQFWTFL